MALCLVLDSNGVLVVDPAPPADQSSCAYLVSNGAEFSSLSNLFGVPDEAALQALWFVGFLVPLTLFIAAVLVGQVVGFWNHPG